MFSLEPLNCILLSLAYFFPLQGITVSAVVYDDDISHVDGLLLPFKKYYISTVEICEIPESTPPGIYRFYWVINNKTTVEEVTDEGGPMLPFYFHLRSFESFHFVADTDEFISCFPLPIILHFPSMDCIFFMLSVLPFLALLNFSLLQKFWLVNEE